MKERLILKVNEVAELLGMSPQNVRVLVYRGRLPARRLGGRLVFIRSELEEALKKLPRVVEVPDPKSQGGGEQK